MISTKEIQTLADLARIEIGEDEIESLIKEMDSILGYVSQIETMAKNGAETLPLPRNVLREDCITNEPMEYTADIVSNMPSHEGNLLKVKKIL